MFNKLKPKSDFARNVLTLMTGTTIAQAIPIAISPILTRLYSPDDFGIFALYMSIVGIMSVIATGGYEHAIMLPKKDEDSFSIMVLSVSIAFFISFAIFLLVWLLNDKITFLLGNSEISLWLYFVPVSILMTGIYQSFNYWSNRKRQYKRLAATKIIQSSSTGVVNISLGFTETGGGGLVLGSVLGQITAASVLSGLVIKEDSSKFSQVSTEKILNLAKRYVDFFKFSNLSSILNAFSFNLFSILLSKIFSISILGFYNLIYRILTMPSVLIGRSIAQVYFEESTKQKNIYGNNRKIFISMLKKLLMLSLIIYLPMYFYIEKLIIFIFGFKWHVSGEIARILLPLMFIRFVSSVLSSTLTTYEKQKSGLIMNFLLASTVIILFLIAYMKNLDIYAFFYMYMFAMSILYGLFIIYYYHLSKGDNR